MSNPNTFDGATDRPMTDAEYAQWQTDAADAAKQAAEADAKIVARNSALMKLKALGLTDAEVAALMGGN